MASLQHSSMVRQLCQMDLLNDDSDVRLVFSDDAVVPAHSQILKQWSGVLRSTMESSDTTSSSSSTTKTITTSERVTSIPMEGTKKGDWLVAMQFMYPVIPQPEVSWDNLEVSICRLQRPLGSCAGAQMLRVLHCRCCMRIL